MADQITLEEKYEHAVEAVEKLIVANAEITAERERARDTAALLEQSLHTAEADLTELHTRHNQILDDLKQGAHLDGFALDLVKDAQQSRDVALEEIENWKRLYDIVEEEKHELREQAKRALDSEVNFVEDLRQEHLDALVTIHIDGSFSVTDRLAAFQFKTRHDFDVAHVWFETAGGTTGYAIDLNQSVKVLAPAREVVPF